MGQKVTPRARKFWTKSAKSVENTLRGEKLRKSCEKSCLKSCQFFAKKLPKKLRKKLPKFVCYIIYKLCLSSIRSLRRVHSPQTHHLRFSLMSSFNLITHRCFTPFNPNTSDFFAVFLQPCHTSPHITHTRYHTSPFSDSMCRTPRSCGGLLSRHGIYWV